MSVIKPFRALRPSAEKAASVACPPYDVVYDGEAREAIHHNPEAFLRVTRPEADMPTGVDANSQAAFVKGRENLREFIEQGLLSLDDEEAVYVYQLAAGEQVQTGVVACCSIDEYEQGTIKRHEKTRPDKVADRTGHMVTVGAQTGLVFLAFRGTDRTRELISQTLAGEPLYDFVSEDAVRQRVWRSTDTQAWVDAFQQVPAIYIADGHHRVESARLAREQLRGRNPNHTGDESYNYVVAGIFPAEDLKILPYNRVVKDLNALARDEFLVRVADEFSVEQTDVKEPVQRGQMCMYLDGEWFSIDFAGKTPDDPISRLDVSILQEHLLTPILGVGDPRTDTRITFVGGKRGTDELERMVDENGGGVAFSMFATSMDDLLAVSDAGEIMPPKSTWFEPKLKDGLLVHMI